MPRREDGRYEKYHGRRYLLNTVPGQQTTAAIVAEIEDTSTWRGEVLTSSYDQPSTTLQFANCDRSISFDCSVDGKGGRYENDLKKLDLMIESLQAFRRGFKLERERHVRRRQAAGHGVDQSY